MLMVRVFPLIEHRSLEFEINDDNVFVLPGRIFSVVDTDGVV